MAKKKASNSKTSDDGERNQPGRPTIYDPAFHPRAAKKLCEMGATVRDLADAFGVVIVTIWNWQVAHPEFAESLQVGRSAADDRVERAFYERACGYTFDATKIMTINGRVHRENYREHVPPDPRAGEFWLRNRRADRWKDKQHLDLNHRDPDGVLQKLSKALEGTGIRPKED